MSKLRLKVTPVAGALGAEITYLSELSSDCLADALTSERIHALVGVPALFQLLHRQLTQELAQRPKAVERAAEMLKDDLEAKGPVRISEVESSQKEILQLARRLADSGQIALAGKGEQYV